MTAVAKTFSVLDRIETYQSQMPATMAKIAAVLMDDPKVQRRTSRWGVVWGPGRKEAGHPRRTA